MWTDFPLFPQAASSLAGRVDALYLFLVAVTAFFTFGIFIAVIYFAIRYRRSRHANAEQIEGSLALELTWSLIPLAIAMVIFGWSASVYFTYARPPRDALHLYGIGKQWMWKFQHADGQTEINQLHVPVGRDVKITLISQDVIHSFFVPAFRLKMDVLPGRYRTVWFRPTRTGSYHLFCAEYCGTQHSGMRGTVVVLEPAEYEAWLSGGGDHIASQGEALFRHYQCIGCHRADSGARGPDLAGLYGKTVHLADGSTVQADETYIRESILQPKTRMVAGFQPIMPVYQGQINEEDLLRLVSYIRSLRQSPLNVNPTAPTPPQGQPFTPVPQYQPPAGPPKVEQK